MLTEQEVIRTIVIFTTLGGLFGGVFWFYVGTFYQANKKK